MNPLPILSRQSLVLLITLLVSACGINLWGTYDPDPTEKNIVSTSETLFPYMISATTRVGDLTPTFTPTRAETIQPASSTPDASLPAILYKAQSGDSLDVVAIHFGVTPEEVLSSEPLPEVGFITPGTILIIPNRLSGIPTTPSEKILPDSEVVFGPSAVDFDIRAYVDQAGGVLSTFHEYLAIPGTISGAEAVERLAFESSINPRLLLAFIQYLSGWVFGEPLPGVDKEHPLGYDNPFFVGLYQEMRLLVQELDAGYYGWRAGTLTELTFPDGTTLRLSPQLNAGTVALQYLFSKRLSYDEWSQVITPGSEFLILYNQMYGDAWERARRVEPLFPPALIQPQLSLPSEVGYPWAFTGGPHPAWEQESALAALDFAPASAESGCVESPAWVVALAPGKIVRSSGGYVLLDLDGDGFEQTGWVVLYMHIATKDRIAAGIWVDAGDRIGHPSCEGGRAVGTHVHLARKYNGEWVGAGGALPFVLSGWTAHEGAAPYYGTLTKGDRTITSSTTATFESQFTRQPDE